MADLAVRQGDQIIATDTHIVLVPSPPGQPVPTPLPHPFMGNVSEETSNNVKINSRPAAVQGSRGRNMPPHFPSAPGSFQSPPSNEGKIVSGSSTVKINGKPAARMSDQVETCADPVPNRGGRLVLAGPCTVKIGG